MTPSERRISFGSEHLTELEWQRIQVTWPNALIKALVDEFRYVIGLVNGGVIECDSVTAMNPYWIHVDRVREHNLGGLKQSDYGYGPFPFSRGIDIQVSAIAWVSDAAGYDS